MTTKLEQGTKVIAVKYVKAADFTYKQLASPDMVDMKIKPNHSIAIFYISEVI